MKLTVQEILSMRNSLVKLLQKEIPIKTAFRLSRIAKTLQKELEVFEEQRSKLVEKYGEKNEETGTISVNDKEKQDEFTKEINLILEEVIKMDISPIKTEDIGNDVKISTTDIMTLEKILSQKKE